jgi:hypothetical protein
MEAEVKEMDSTASLEINLVTVVLNNDITQTIRLETPSAWINNDPQVFGKVTLERRQKVDLVLSNVFSSSLRSVGFASIGKVYVE